eukprot:TRINITY_DN4600_c0_g2_i1.p1 TRINITY_DN4600_c0_g2~~TRINITY_DN4600_c0_g2_i1.p1  ORF type:complete len:422 (+),score=65.43 TRINITY_DN4600_c0_g2_i1:1-1266(+)
MNDLPEMPPEDKTDTKRQTIHMDFLKVPNTVQYGGSFKSAETFAGASKSLNDLPGMNPEPPTGIRSAKSSPQHRGQFIPSEDFGLEGRESRRAASWQGARVHCKSSDEAHAGPLRAMIGDVQSAAYGARGRRNCRTRSNTVTFKGSDQSLTCNDVSQSAGASFSSRRTTEPLSSFEASDGCLCGDDLPMVKSESEDDTNAMVSMRSVEREGDGLMCLEQLPHVDDESIVFDSVASNWSSCTGSVYADDANASGFEAPQAKLSQRQEFRARRQALQSLQKKREPHVSLESNQAKDSEPCKEIVDVESLLRPIEKLLAEHEVRLAIDLIRQVSRSSMGGMNTCIEKGDWVSALESFSLEKSDKTKDLFRDCMEMSGVKRCTLAVSPSALRQPGGPRRPPNRRLLRTKAISEFGTVVTSSNSSS